MKNWRITLALILLFCCSACRPGYILQAGKGQFDLIMNSIPIEEAIRGDKINAEQKIKLRMVACVKSYGEEVLGLKKTGSYRAVYLKSPEGPVYLVMASPKDRLELKTWWFPIVGKMPYLGFFNLEGARAERDKLSKEDMDVIICKADAYSTLGWLDDPVTLNLINGSIIDLAEVILHEMTHATLYINGQGEFNEGLALLVGKVGALMFIEKTYGPLHPFAIEARHSIEDERLFSTFLLSLLKKLEMLYSSSFSYRRKLLERKKAFDSSLEGFNQLKKMFHTDRFEGFGCSGLNNAYLMMAGLYHRNFILFESVLKEHNGSVKEMLSFFKRFEGEEGDLLAKISRQFSFQEINGR